MLLLIVLSSSFVCYSQRKTNIGINFIVLFSFHKHPVRIKEKRFLNVVPSKQLEYIYLRVRAFESRNNHIKIISIVESQTLALSQYRLKKTFSIPINYLYKTLIPLENLQLITCLVFSKRAW